MKNKHLLLAITLFTSIFLSSCSKDDDGNEPQQTKLLDKVILTFSDSNEIITHSFEYNQDFSIQKMSKTSSVEGDVYTVFYEYSSNSVKFSLLLTNGQATTLELKYEDGIFTEFILNDSNGEQNLELDYNPQTDVYTFSGFPLKFDDANNVLSFLYEYEYNTIHKGSLFNVPNKGIHVLNILLYDYNSQFMTSKPLNTFTDGSVIVNFANEFDDDDFLIKAIQTNSVNSSSVIFNYSYILK